MTERKTDYRRADTRRRPTASKARSRETAREHPAATHDAMARPVEESPTGKHRVGALDGIRALAIVAVVVYHADSSWLPGGFLGVTVFFALSGYLITGGIVDELERLGAFRLRRFYAKRLRRLWPLMLVVVLVVALLTAIFSTVLLQKMQPDVLPSLLFFDNIWYIVQDLSYFEAAGQPSPLTHFWYLGVIGQFYLVWPLLIWGLWKIVPSRTAVRRFALACMVASFALMLTLYDPAADASRVYYGTDTRFAELMLGAWLSLAFPINGTSALAKRLEGTVLSRRPVADALGAAALVVLVVMALSVTGSTVFLYRGGYLLVAALVGVIVFVVRDERSLLGRLLALRPLSYLSTRSYGLYLWHYPLLLIMNPATRTTELPWWGWVIEFVVIFGATELGYRFIELPTGSGKIGEPFARMRSGSASLPALFATNKLRSGIVGGLLVAAVAVLALGPVWDADLREENLRNDPIYKLLHADIPGQVQAKITRYTNSADPDTGQSQLGVFLIGDSVALDAEQQFYEKFPYGYLDAAIGRQTSEAVDIYNQALAEGRSPEVVVFALGTNGPVNEEMVRGVLDLVSNCPVYWVNNRMPDEWQDSNNETIARVVAEYPNAHLVDWYAESAGHDDWFWDDGTHTRPEGADAYMDLIARSIAGSQDGK